jgi:hypothetical protein
VPTGAFLDFQPSHELANMADLDVRVWFQRAAVV